LELRELTQMSAEGGVAPVSAARECVSDFGCTAHGEEDMVVQNGKVDNLVLLNAQNFFWSSEDAATLPTHYGEAAG